MPRWERLEAEVPVGVTKLGVDSWGLSREPGTGEELENSRQSGGALGLGTLRGIDANELGVRVQDRQGRSAL